MNNRERNILTGLTACVALLASTPLTLPALADEAQPSEASELSTDCSSPNADKVLCDALQAEVEHEQRIQLCYVFENAYVGNCRATKVLDSLPVKPANMSSIEWQNSLTAEQWDVMWAWEAIQSGDI